MRISDWSSDVCSSDLFYPGVPVLRTIGRRLLLLIPTLFGLSVLLFFWVRALPGGPAVALLGERATPEAVERINELYGFNEPLYVQYFTWLGRLLTGDFGSSIQTGRPVLEIGRAACRERVCQYV